MSSKVANRWQKHSYRCMLMWAIQLLLQSAHLSKLWRRHLAYKRKWKRHALVIDSSTEVVIGTAAVLAVPWGGCRNTNDKGETYTQRGKERLKKKEGMICIYPANAHSHTHMHKYSHTLPCRLKQRQLPGLCVSVSGGRWDCRSDPRSPHPAVQYAPHTGYTGARMADRTKRSSCMLEKKSHTYLHTHTHRLPTLAKNPPQCLLCLCIAAPFQ